MGRRRRRRVSWDDAAWSAVTWLAALLWSAIRPGARWVGHNATAAVIISAKAAGRGGLTITAGVYLAGREKAREIGEHGSTLSVLCACGCDQRLTIAQATRHLAALEDETPPARPEVPTGTRRLAVEGGPRTTLAEHARPRRRPREWEVECPHCHDWIGPRRLWPVHAEGCNAAAAAKQRRIDAALNWRWHNARDGLNNDELAQVEILRAVDPLPWVDVLPVTPVAPKDPSPAGGAVTTKGIDEMQDPRALLKGADAFADPAINRDNWEIELLEFFRLCAHVEVQLRERIAEGMVQYLTKAELPHSVVQHVLAAAVDHDNAGTDFLKARKATEDWIAALKTPFAKV